ncbi:MAG: FHIPEP family type III secretion protein [Patulibacter minatonensis]
MEAVGDRARVTRDPNLLAEYARQTLGRAIVGPHLDEESCLRAIALDPAIEQEVADAITATADGEYLAMEPSRAQALVQALQQQSEQPLPGWEPPRAAVQLADPAPPAPARRADRSATSRVRLYGGGSRRYRRDGRGGAPLVDIDGT